MQIYLVGGAVRDGLLQRPVKDKDYVVVGTTPEQMKAKGFQQVGKDFPVFLHPETKQEYALARTERKSGSGYTGFECYSGQDVSLEDDLNRRDLTINAMAQDENGHIFDPHGGQQDLAGRTLRHVSDAFSEDPLRVLRVARFAARYAEYGFSVHNSTMQLMTEMSASGELNHLTAERVWTETARALGEQQAHVYFEVLRACGALAVLLPELDCLWGIPNPEQWHPEIDTGVHTMMVLKQAINNSQDKPADQQLTIRFAALCHDLGKGVTPAEKWPSHHGHELAGVDLIKQVSQRLKVPNDCRDLAILVSEFHCHTHKAFDLKPNTILKVFNKTDAWRKWPRFEQFLLCCDADFHGRKGFKDRAYPQVDYLKACYNAANEVDVKQIVTAGYQGKAIREQLDQQRIKAIKSVTKPL